MLVLSNLEELAEAFSGVSGLVALRLAGWAVALAVRAAQQEAEGGGDGPAAMEVCASSGVSDLLGQRRWWWWWWWCVCV